MRPAQMIPCTIPGCDVLAQARGWCQPHYKRWLRWGDPEGAYEPTVWGGLGSLTDAEIERFLSRIQINADGCWPWIGQVNNHGYGRFAVYRGGGRIRLLAHRVSMYLAGTEGPVARHTCDNPPCVRPEHLMPGTQAENLRDAMERGRMNLDGLVIGQQRKRNTPTKEIP